MSDFETCELADMVAIGATDAAGARVWIRTTRPGPHTLELWSEKLRHTASLELVPPAASDNTLSLRVPEDLPGAPALAPRTTYHVRVLRDAHVLGTGCFETAPLTAADAPRRFAFAMMSCHQPFAEDGALKESSLRTLAALARGLRERDVKRVFLMGDQMYADYPEHLSLFDADHFATVAPRGRDELLACTREEVRALYQRRYRAFWSVEPFRELLAAYPCHALPDDHELRDNFGSDPEHATPRWAALREGALDAFHDYQGLLARGRDTPRPDSFDYAITYAGVGVYALDVRSQRRCDGETLQVCRDEQLDALERYLADGSALEAVLVITSVPLAIFPSWVASLGSRLLGRDSDAADRWSHDAATAHRRRLTRLLFEHQRRNPHQHVLLLGGDIHIGCAVQFVWRDRSVRPLVQLVSSSVSNLTGPLTRKLGKLAPHLDRHLSGADDDLWERIDLLPGREGADENPFDGLNAGIITFERAADGSLGVQLELVTNDDERPPGLRTVFAT